MFEREITMTISEFCQVQRGEKTYKDIKEKKTFERFLGSLDDRAMKLMSFTIGTLLFASKRASAETVTKDPVAAAEGLGWEMLRVLQKAGLWICIIGCIIEILFCVFKRNGGKDEIIAIVFKWFLILLSLYVVPQVFIYVAEYFGI